MAARKNVVVSISEQNSGAKIAMQIGTSETLEMDADTFRSRVEDINTDELLFCLLSVKAEAAGLNARTATFAQLKSLVDGNYKVLPANA